MRTAIRKATHSGPHQGLLPANWAPLTLFALAYIAILGVLFAPEGFFTQSAPPMTAGE